MWSEADEDEKDLIVQRLGIAIQPQNKTSVECHFEHIGEEVIKKIISAKKWRTRQTLWSRPCRC